MGQTRAEIQLPHPRPLGTSCPKGLSWLVLSAPCPRPSRTDGPAPAWRWRSGRGWEAGVGGRQRRPHRGVRPRAVSGEERVSEVPPGPALGGAPLAPSFRPVSHWTRAPHANQARRWARHTAGLWGMQKAGGGHTTRGLDGGTLHPNPEPSLGAVRQFTGSTRRLKSECAGFMIPKAGVLPKQGRVGGRSLHSGGAF